MRAAPKQESTCRWGHQPLCASHTPPAHRCKSEANDVRVARTRPMRPTSATWC